MGSKQDYIPSNDHELLAFAKTFLDYAMANYERWEVPAPYDLFHWPIAAFENALVAHAAPNHGKVDTLVKNEAKKTLIAALRTYIQGYIARNPKVTDVDKEKMGLPLHDMIPTPHPVPKEKSEAEAVPTGRGQHTVTAINPHTQSKEKPPLVEGVSFAHRLRNADEPQARAEDMPSLYQTAAVRVFQWSQSDYGKIADYATVYEAAGGKRGPWSDVVPLIIS